MVSRVVRTGIVGAGVFGGYHAQKMAGATGASLVGIFDPDIERANLLGTRHGTRAFLGLNDLISECDALIIASPPTTHFSSALKALTAGLHVLVEKPLALTGTEADQLVQMASARNKVLQGGHQERFVFRAMGLLDLPEAPVALRASRAGAPTGRSMDVSIIDDLMVHDLDLALLLLGDGRTNIGALSWSGEEGRIDSVLVKLEHQDCALELVADRNAPDRYRTMALEYPSGTVEIDFLARTIRNQTPFEIKADVSDFMPDPLAAADEAFIRACAGEDVSPIPGHEAAKAVRLVELVRSACNENQRVEVDQDRWVKRAREYN